MNTSIEVGQVWEIIHTDTTGNESSVYDKIIIKSVGLAGLTTMSMVYVILLDGVIAGPWSDSLLWNSYSLIKP